VKVNITLRYWKSCLLLRATGTGDDRLALLVVPFRVSQLKRGRLLKCRYIGVVTEDRKNSEPEIDNLKEGSPWRSHIVRIGGRDRDVTRVLDGETAMEQMIDDPMGAGGEQEAIQKKCRYCPLPQDFGTTSLRNGSAATIPWNENAKTTWYKR